MPDLSDQIEQAAADPAAFTSDGQSFTSRSVADLIQADQYLTAKRARKKKLRGVYLTQLITPGASGIDCAGSDPCGGCR